MNKVVLHAKFYAYMLLCFQDTDIKNGFAGPKSFRGFRETGPWLTKKAARTWERVKSKMAAEECLNESFDSLE